ncbi:MAG: NifU family protein [Chlamydiales bacterium]|nr:NifU family protein [Chlamydiales bacterium]
MKPYPWQNYTKKTIEKILHPQYGGRLTACPGMRLVSGTEGSLNIDFLVDETDGVIADVKYTHFGSTALVASLEAACALAMRKNYAQVRRFTADLIDKELHLPKETFSHLNLVLSAMDMAMEKCVDLPLPEEYIAPPMPTASGEVCEYPGFKDLDKAKKIAIIEQMIDTEVRPYIELDDGGIRIVDLKGDEVLIAYEGACTTCYSATGATLNAISQALKTKIHPDLEVKPDLSNLEF